MPFNIQLYKDYKNQLEKKLAMNWRTPVELMQIYMRSVESEDYELCKAIDEILKPINYDVTDTHKHIKHLNK